MFFLEIFGHKKTLPKWKGSFHNGTVQALTDLVLLNLAV